MNDTRSDFTFGLSRDELLWLIAVFDLSHLPLPEPSFLSVPPQELRERQRAGAHSLQQRGLLRQEGGTWQVERLAAGLLQAMAMAQEWLRLDYRTCSGLSRALHFFASPDIRFLFDLAEGYARFCLCADPATAAEALWGWLALPSGLEAGEGALSLPQPFDFLPLAWNNPHLAARVLQKHGLPAQNIPTALGWTASLEWVCAASVQERRSGGVAVRLRFVSCGDSARLWGGFEQEGLAVLSGLLPADLRAALAELP